jgi:DNA repair protein RecO (recombination protein O)
MRSSKIEAIIIKKRNFQEKDRILTLFSKDRGKLEAIAKGSRRPGSRFSYFSDIGSIGQFYLYESKSIPIITDYKSIFSPDDAWGKINRTEKLSFAYKIVDKVFEQAEPHRKTYEVLRLATEKLSENDDQLVFLSFLVNMISDLGLKPELYKCTVCGKKIKDSDNLMFRNEGGVSHAVCTRGTSEKIKPDEVKLLRLMLELPYNKISRAKVSEKIFNKVYNIVLSYIEWNFGKILPDKVL